MAAVAAAREGAGVLVLEGDVKPRRKLLATGNGRCNLSNAIIENDWIEAAQDAALDAVSAACTSTHDFHLPSNLAYRNLDFARNALSAMGCKQTRAVFADMGLETFEDMEGRVYPITNKARSVADVLANECEALGVQTELDAEVIEVQPHDGVWTCRIGDGRLFHSKCVVVATGGVLGMLDRLGLSIQLRHPVLGPLATQNKLARKLSGVRSRCVTTLKRGGSTLLQMQGEVLFRKYGLSGIVIFDISRFAQQGDVIVLDIIPIMSINALAQNLERRVMKATGTESGTCRKALDGLLQPEIADALLAEMGTSPDASTSKLDVAQLAWMLKHLEFEVTDGVLDDGAQCARGGIDVSEVDASTMAVRSQSGLFACGEAIDVDAACGGFNLQWAWSSGFAAGNAAAKTSKASSR